MMTMRKKEIIILVKTMVARSYLLLKRAVTSRAMISDRISLLRI